MWKSVNQYVQQPVKKISLILVKVVFYREKFQIINFNVIVTPKGNEGCHEQSDINA